MTFGSILKGLRVEQGVSLRGLAQASGLDVAYLSRLERDIMNAPINEDFYEKVSSALRLASDQARKLKDVGDLSNQRIPGGVEFSSNDMEYLPILLRTINNKKLNEDQYKELARVLNEQI